MLLEKMGQIHASFKEMELRDSYQCTRSCFLGLCHDKEGGQYYVIAAKDTNGSVSWKAVSLGFALDLDISKAKWLFNVVVKLTVKSEKDLAGSVVEFVQFMKDENFIV